MKHALAVLIALMSLCGCGDSFVEETDPGPVEPANFAGSYSVNFLNVENGCRLENWTDGNTAMGIPISMQQDGSALTATVEGLTGDVLRLYIGANRLSGTVEESRATLTLLGEPRSTDGCDSILDATFHVTLSGDAVSGDASYVREAVGGTCTFPQPCETVQKLSGARVPQ